jgi:hypothetical protein
MEMICCGAVLQFLHQSQFNSWNLGYDATGPEVFNAVVQKQQQFNASLLRALVLSLSKIKLSIEPAQDVEAFGNQIREMARQIEGTGLVPNDLSLLVATAFLDSNILKFQLRALALHDKVDEYLSSQMADKIVRTLKQKWQSLHSQGLWTLAEGKHKDIGHEAAELKAVINKFVQSDKNRRKVQSDKNRRK